MHFDIFKLVTSSNVINFTSQKVEYGVVKVDDGEDEIAMDSKGTAVL